MKDCYSLQSSKLWWQVLIKSFCFALFYQIIWRQRPEEKLENTKNFFFLNYAFFSMKYSNFGVFILRMAPVDDSRISNLNGSLKVFISYDLRKNIVFWHWCLFSCLFLNNSKIIQRAWNLDFHIFCKLCVQILKNLKNKAKRQSLRFISISLICSISNRTFSFKDAP